MPVWCRATADGVEPDVWVVPGESRSAVRGVHDGRLRLAVTAPAEDIKANRVVLQLIGDLVAASPHQVRLVRGRKSRTKTVSIDALDAWELVLRLVVCEGGAEGEAARADPAGRRRRPIVALSVQALEQASSTRPPRLRPLSPTMSPTAPAERPPRTTMRTMSPGRR